MSVKIIVTVFVIVVALLGVTSMVYVYLRNSTMEDIRADVYQLFLKAEHKYIHTGEGKQKMKWVIGRARGLLPEWAQLLITDEFLERVIESWFRAVKDLLDDGKYNKSTQEGE